MLGNFYKTTPEWWWWLFPPEEPEKFVSYEKEEERTNIATENIYKTATKWLTIPPEAEEITFYDIPGNIFRKRICILFELVYLNPEGMGGVEVYLAFAGRPEKKFENGRLVGTYYCGCAMQGDRDKAKIIFEDVDRPYNRCTKSSIHVCLVNKNEFEATCIMSYFEKSYEDEEWDEFVRVV